MIASKWTALACALVCLAGIEAPAAAEEAVVSARDIEEALTRDIGIAPRIDQKDNLSSAESSPYISLRSIQFDLNSSAIRTSSSQQLDELAKALKSERVAGNRLLIEGHTCDLGTQQHNMALSHARAAAVKQYLASQGVSPGMIDTRGWGFTRPVVPNLNESCRARNRRVDIVCRRDGAKYASTRGIGDKHILDVTFQPAEQKPLPLKSGDTFGATVKALQGCHVYPLFRDSSGGVHWLQMDAEGDDWVVSDPAQASNGFWCYFGQTRHLPRPSECYVLDDQVGTEVLCVVASPKPLADAQDLARLLKEHGPELDSSSLEPGAELHLLVIDHRAAQSGAM